MNPQLVFVYGTLKKGNHNHHLIAKANYCGKAHTTKSEYQMYHLGGFPGVTKGDRVIYGEVYMVNEDVMKSLDRLEGHPSFYERILVPVGIYGDKKGEETSTKAWIYIYKGDTTDCMPIKNWS